MDLQVARYEIVRLMRMLGLREGWTHTHFQAGLSGERESGGTNFIGPGFSGELPIFNYGQAARMRLYAQLRQAQGQLAALEIRVATEVREACQLLRNRLDIVDSYRDHLLPMQHQLLHSSEALYNVMGLGIDRLIENKRIAVGINQQYIESLKNYLVAQVMLDRALGGNLPLLLLQSKEALP